MKNLLIVWLLCIGMCSDASVDCLSTIIGYNHKCKHKQVLPSTVNNIHTVLMENRDCYQIELNDLFVYLLLSLLSQPLVISSIGSMLCMFQTWKANTYILELQNSKVSFKALIVHSLESCRFFFLFLCQSKNKIKIPQD